MISRTSLTAACLALTAVLASARAEAQVAVQPQPSCPPGQPCVVVVPQQQPAPQEGYVVVQPQQPQPTGYVTVQAQPYAQPVQQRQPVEVTRTRLRWGLIGPGIGLVIGGWVGNWITGMIGSIAIAFGGEDAANNFGWSWVPFVGPWVNAAISGSNGIDGLMGMHLLWGALQVGGLLMCILGTVFPEETTEIQYVDGDQTLRFAVLPWADATGGGASVSITGF